VNFHLLGLASRICEAGKRKKRASEASGMHQETEGPPRQAVGALEETIRTGRITLARRRGRKAFIRRGRLINYSDQVRVQELGDLAVGGRSPLKTKIGKKSPVKFPRQTFTTRRRDGKGGMGKKSGREKLAMCLARRKGRLTGNASCVGGGHRKEGERGTSIQRVT